MAPGSDSHGQQNFPPPPGLDTIDSIAPGDGEDPLDRELWRVHDRYGYPTRELAPERADEQYSRPAAERDADVRHVRRDRWQSFLVLSLFFFIY